MDDAISEFGTQQTEVVDTQLDIAGVEDEKEDSQLTPLATLRDGDTEDAAGAKPVKSSNESVEGALAGPSSIEQEKGSDSNNEKNEPDSELIVSQIQRPTESKQDNSLLPQGEASSTNKDSNSPGKPANADVDHLPEPPASPTSNTAFSGTSTSSTVNHDLPAKPVTNTSKMPSANRVSIAYAAGSKRLLLDAEIVEKMVVFRAEGRIDIDMTVGRVSDGFKGILVLLFYWFFVSFSFNSNFIRLRLLEKISHIPPFQSSQKHWKQTRRYLLSGS